MEEWMRVVYLLEGAAESFHAPLHLAILAVAPMWDDS
jgi:hypothetical protein